MNKLLLVVTVFAGTLAIISAGGGGGYKGGGYEGGGYKGGDGGGGDYAAAPSTAAPTVAPVVAPTAAPTAAPTTVQQRCITDGGGMCAASCTIGTFTVEDTSFSCDGNGVGSVCCLAA